MLSNSNHNGLQRNYNKQAKCLRKHLCKLLEDQIKLLYSRKINGSLSKAANQTSVVLYLKSIAEVKLAIKKEGQRSFSNFHAVVLIKNPVSQLLDLKPQ